MRAALHSRDRRFFSFPHHLRHFCGAHAYFLCLHSPPSSPRIVSPMSFLHFSSTHIASPRSRKLPSRYLLFRDRVLIIAALYSSRAPRPSEGRDGTMTLRFHFSFAYACAERNSQNYRAPIRKDLIQPHSNIPRASSSSRISSFSRYY